MIYPTLEEVEKADHQQICYWWRFLPSPGSRFIGLSHDSFNQAIRIESQVMDAIVERFKCGGGMTANISRSIGWDK